MVGRKEFQFAFETLAYWIGVKWKLMENWIPPNAEYPPPKAGEPPIHLAARTGNQAQIRALITEGADPNLVFDIGLDPGAMGYPATPLMVAAGSGDGASVSTVALLLELGADPKVIIEGRTAASFAASGLGWNYRPGGDSERLKLLVEAGSPVAGSRETEGRMLQEAATGGNVDLVAALLDLGLDPNGTWSAESASERTYPQPDLGFSEGGFPKEFRSAMQDVWKSMFEKIASGPSKYEIPLFGAAMSGSPACVQLLVDRGANLNVRDNQDRTALFDAGSKEVIEQLMGLGLSLEDRDEYGWTPLVNAIGEGIDSIEKIRWLIELGADVNGTHDRGFTVFMSAVSSERDVRIMKLLVEAGADPHAVSELGFNAFHAAVDVNGYEANQEPCVRSVFTYLRELGVDINLKNKSKKTPLALAKITGTDITVKVLKELGAK